MGKKDLPAPLSNCRICSKECITECVKCATCKAYVHVICTQLPKYYLVQYFISRVEYKCETCIRDGLPKDDKDNDAFTRELAWVMDRVERERRQLKPPKYVKGPSSKLDDDDDDNGETSALLSDCETEVEVVSQQPRQRNPSDSQPAQTEEQSIVHRGGVDSPKEKICIFYRRGKCKHGRAGKGCQYSHPKLCNKFKINGSNPRGGCRNVKNCKFLHPKICYGSKDKRECYNKECTYLHLKGTRRTPSDTVQIDPNTQTGNEAEFRKRNIKSPQYQSGNHTSPAEPTRIQRAPQINSIQADQFFALQWQLQQMQLQLQQLIAGAKGQTMEKLRCGCPHQTKQSPQF